MTRGIEDGSVYVCIHFFKGIRLQQINTQLTRVQEKLHMRIMILRLRTMDTYNVRRLSTFLSQGDLFSKVLTKCRKVNKTE